jgi:hypothetical protein
LLVRDREPHRFARVALRWHARFCAETAAVGSERGLVRTIEPSLGERELHLVVQLRRDTASPS